MSLTCSNYIVYHQNLLSLLDGIGLDLKEIGTILLLETRLLGWPRQLSTLSNWCESGSQGESKTWTEEKSSCIEPHYNIRLHTEVLNLQLKSTDQGGVSGVIGEEGEDVDEVYSWLWEVGKVSESSVQFLLCTGDCNITMSALHFRGRYRIRTRGGR